MDILPPSLSLSLTWDPISPPVVAYVIAVGVFLGIDNDYGGFFSLNGEPSSGCLSYSFGLAVGAFLTNLMGGFLGIIAFVYEYRKKMDDPRDY